jgi:hypothetical protein
MLRKTMIALLAAASVVILSPSEASARGGFGGGGGGFHGGGGGFHGGGFGGGGFHGGGFRAASIGGGGFHPAAVGGGGFRPAAVGGAAFRSAPMGTVGSAAVGRSAFRSGPLAANAFADPGGFRSGGFRGRDFDRGFRHHGRRFGFGAFAVGLGYGLYGPYYDDYYDYPDYAYDDSYYGDGYYGDAYYGDGGCYVVQQRVRTAYGWRLRPVQVCN